MTVENNNVSSGRRIPLIVNGKDVYAALTFPVVSPSDAGTGRVLWQASSASADEARQAVEAASAASPAWAATKPAARRDLLLRAASLLEAPECANAFVESMRKETGALEPFSRFNVSIAISIMRDVAGRISGALTGTAPVCEDEGTYALVVKEPYGVVLGIAPWNAPYALGFRAAVYALAAGNTCVLKGSELSPRCFWLIGNLFRDAGLPDGCLSVLYHRTEDAAAITKLLIEHPAIKKINFTGSSAVGSIVSELAGRNLKPVLMELGGKNNAIVCADADLALAAEQCALGAFFHAGQICMSTERILVNEAIVEPFTLELKKAIARIFAPDGEKTAFQRLAPTAGHHKVTGLLQDAVAKGGTVVHGEIVASAEPETALQPTVITGITKDMTIYDTESFGPSVSLLPVSNDDVAVAIANDSEYGLSGAVFTRDLARGLALAARLETGAVHINGMSVHDEAALPHGGAKKSGWGRFNADAGLNEFLRTKNITYRLPTL